MAGPIGSLLELGSLMFFQDWKHFSWGTSGDALKPRVESLHMEKKAMLLLLVSSQGQDKVSVEVLEPRWGAESVLMPGWTIYLSIYLSKRTCMNQILRVFVGSSIHH